MHGSASTSSAARSAARAIVTHDRRLPFVGRHDHPPELLPDERRSTTTVTWCTKDKNGTSPPVAGAQPYTLWRYSGTSCSGTGTPWASNLVDKADAPSIAAGKIFDSSRVPAASSLTPATTGGTLGPGTYSYDVTAVLASGAEIPGTVASVTIASGLTNKITLSWSAYVPVTATVASYNVYGRDGAGLRLLKNVTSGTSYVDPGPTVAHGQPADAPERHDRRRRARRASTRARTRSSSGRPGVVTCTGTTSTSFTGCSGGQPGQYPQNMPVYSASSARPPSTNAGGDAPRRRDAGDDLSSASC